MMQRVRATAQRFWRWLLGRARAHPWPSGLAVSGVLLVVSLWLGWIMTFWEDSLVKWLDYAFIVLGGISLTLGWGFALVLKAKQHEAAMSFRHAGRVIEPPLFDAALILASPSEPLMQWHLHQLPHERIELVWTERTRTSAGRLLDLFPHQVCLHGPGRDAEEPLEDAFDFALIKKHCRTLLQEILSRYPAHRVCLDLTGGTAVMSLAAFQVAEELGITSLYLMGNQIGPRGTPEILEEHVNDPGKGQVKIVSDHGKARNPRFAPAESAHGADTQNG